MAREGKAVVLQVVAGGDVQEGKATPIALLGENGRAALARELLIYFRANGTNEPIVTELINTTGETYTFTRAGVGVYVIQFSETDLSDLTVSGNAYISSDQTAIQTVYFYPTGTTGAVQMRDSANNDANPAPFGTSGFSLYLRFI